MMQASKTNSTKTNGTSNKHDAQATQTPSTHSSTNATES